MHAAAFVLSSLPPPPARVLEVGCGAGELALTLDAAGYDVVAVDPQAPEGPIFRRMRLEELDDPGPFEAAIARYSLHHMHELEAAVARIAALLRPGGKLVLEEFGWDRVDGATAAWIAEQQGGESAAATLADWRAEHEGLHGYEQMRRALEGRFAERSFEWRPYLSRSLGRPELEAGEREAIDRGAISAVGFRYTGTRA
jgi:SAM-dependent methyltransferase